MAFIEDIATYSFLQNALLAAIFAGISCGIIGTYVVVRRLVFMGAGITHASFGGIGIAYWAGVNPLLGAAIFAVLSALGVNQMSRKGNIREDSAIGVFWAIGMAIGVIFIFLTPGYTPNLMSFLFGNILTITPDILILNGAMALLLVALFAIMGRSIQFAAFDRNYAISQGVKVDLIDNIAMIAIALVVVLVIKLVGIVLLVSLLTIAPITVNKFTSSFFKIMIWSVVVTIAASFCGIAISYYTNLPSGASIIVVLGLFYITSRAIPTHSRRRIRHNN